MKQGRKQSPGAGKKIPEMAKMVRVESPQDGAKQFKVLKGVPRAQQGTQLGRPTWDVKVLKGVPRAQQGAQLEKPTWDAEVLKGVPRTL